MVIEVLSGSRDKYEYQSEWEAFVLDRIILSAVFFRWIMVLFLRHGLRIMIL